MAKEIIKFQCRADKCLGIYLLLTLIVRHYGTPSETPGRLCNQIRASIPIYAMYDAAISQYVLKRVSFGSKDCTKELKLECAYFLGQTS